jgi:hypothetical protein
MSGQEKGEKKAQAGEKTPLMEAQGGQVSRYYVT